MTRRILVRPAADRDIDAQVRYLQVEAGHDVAIRFYEAVQRTALALLEMPRKGAVYATSSAILEGLRSFPVIDFTRHVIFYRPTVDGIEVIRVLHGARDLDTVLGAGGR